MTLICGDEKGNAKFQFFEGRGWIRAPRTGYTYVQSPTYREDWTPDRDDVPMPHMARHASHSALLRVSHFVMNYQLRPKRMPFHLMMTLIYTGDRLVYVHLVHIIN